MSYLDTAKDSLEALRSRSAPLSTEKPAVAVTGPSPEEVAAMRLSAFARAGLILRVYSGVLERDVHFVSDDVPESDLPDSDLPVYRAAELRKLALLRPEPHDLRRIHETKTIFHGVITDVRPSHGYDRDHRRRAREA
jgi:hypothetical protein